MTSADTSPETVASMPRIGDLAPGFTASTTQGQINFPADYKGKWVIFFSHPADFTPVCTSEFITFASMQDEFRKYNTGLKLRTLGINLLGARNSALQNLVAEIPPPVVAQLLSYSHNCTQRHAQLAAQPWSRYVT